MSKNSTFIMSTIFIQVTQRPPVFAIITKPPLLIKIRIYLREKGSHRKRIYPYLYITFPDIPFCSTKIFKRSKTKTPAHKKSIINYYTHCSLRQSTTCWKSARLYSRFMSASTWSLPDCTGTCRNLHHTHCTHHTPHIPHTLHSLHHRPSSAHYRTILPLYLPLNMEFSNSFLTFF